MWVILGNKLQKVFDYKQRRIISVSKVNVLIGGNDSGKSFFMRNLAKHIIAIKDNSFFEKEIDDFIKGHGPYDFPFILTNHIFEEKKYDEFLKYKDTMDYLKNEYRENKESNRMFTATRQYPLLFNNLIKAENCIEVIRKLANEINFPVNEKFNKNNVEFIIDEFLPKFEDAMGSWLKDVYTPELIKKTNRVDEIEDFFEHSGTIERLKDEYSHYKKIYPIQVDRDEYIEEDARFKMIIPINRSLRHPLKDIGEPSDVYEKDVYKTRYLSEYDIDKNYVEIFTGLDLYIKYKRSLLGSVKQRKSIISFERFLSETFFEGKKISIIPDEMTFELKININGEIDQPLYNIGDGISSIIILFYNLFTTYSKKQLFFIEEPETNMHPGFQRLFMEIIANNKIFDNKVFFFTTHSNHIVDASIENKEMIRLFQIQKVNEKIQIQNKEHGSHNILKALGVLPSSVFLTNKVIWIEGKYDALFIRDMLEHRYKQRDSGELQYKRYIEGIDYSFIPYAGSNRTLIDFNPDADVNSYNQSEIILQAVRLNSNYIFILDDDGLKNGREGKKKEFYENIKKKLGEDAYKLDVMEIENLAPKEVIINYAISEIKNNITFSYYSKEYTDKDVITKLKDSIKYGSYKLKKLDAYLNDLIESNFGKENLKTITGTKDGFKVNSGLKNKNLFYYEFNKYINEPEYKQTQAAEKLMDVIYNFISNK